VLDASLARQVGLGGGGTGARGTSTTLLVRIGGNAAAVRAQREELQTLGALREADSDSWRRLRHAEPQRAAVMRWSTLPSRFAETWAASGRVAERWRGTLRHGDPGRGIVRCVLPLEAEATVDSLRAALDVPFGGTRIYERLPAALWPVCAPCRTADRLSRGVKAAFDPHRVLNPGIFGEAD
jgi:FAD/FMN-containing dehydrogenase